MALGEFLHDDRSFYLKVRMGIALGEVEEGADVSALLSGRLLWPFSRTCCHRCGGWSTSRFSSATAARVPHRRDDAELLQLCRHTMYTLYNMHRIVQIYWTDLHKINVDIQFFPHAHIL